jgi:GTPase SAR1 family protein
MAQQHSDVLAVFEARKQQILDLARALKELALEREDHDAAEVLTDFVRRFHENRFLLLTVGDFKSGKSTLVNALAGRSVCPVKATPRTAKITRLMASTDEAEEYVEVSFKEDRASERLPLVESTLDDLVAVGGRRLSDVQMVDVFLRPGSTLLRHPVRLVDTPGLGSNNEEHSRVTRDYMQHADALIIVFSASKPFSDSERDFLLTFRPLLSRAIFVINQIDRVSPEERPEVIDHIRRSLREDVLGPEMPDPKLFPVMSLQALELLKSQGSNAPGLAETGYPAIIDAIERNLAQAHASKLLKSIAEQQQQVAAILIRQATLATDGLESAGTEVHVFKGRKKALLSELSSMASQRSYAPGIEQEKHRLLGTLQTSSETLRTNLMGKVTTWVNKCESEEACKKGLAAFFAKELTNLLENLDGHLSSVYNRIERDTYKELHVLSRRMEEATRHALASKHAQPLTGDESLAQGTAGLSALSAFANSMNGPTGGYGVAASALSQALAPSPGLQILSIATVVTTLLAGFAGPVGWLIAGATGLLTAIFGFSRSTSWRERVLTSVSTRLDEDILPTLRKAMEESIHGFMYGLLTEVDRRNRTVHQRLLTVVEEVSREVEHEEHRRKQEITKLKKYRQNVEGVQQSLAGFITSLGEPAMVTDSQDALTEGQAKS